MHYGQHDSTVIVMVNHYCRTKSCRDDDDKYQSRVERDDITPRSQVGDALPRPPPKTWVATEGETSRNRDLRWQINDQEQKLTSSHREELFNLIGRK